MESLRLPQRKLLGHVLGAEARQAQVRFLKKVVLDNADEHTLGALVPLVKDVAFVLAFKHWRTIPGALLPLLAEEPALCHFTLLRQELDAAQDDYQIRGTIQQRARLVRDTVRMARLLTTRRSRQPVVLRNTQWRGVRALHDRLLKTFGAHGPRAILDSEVDPFRPFPADPMPASPYFAQIRNAAELADEGEAMHHCVLTRAPEALAGRSAIYRVRLAGERATIDISLGEDGRPVAIEDFRLACNAEPSERAWAIADKGLHEG